jgi:hypothetical protein
VSEKWDGTINGVRAPLETYTWVVECYDVNGVKITRKGMVSLIRNSASVNTYSINNGKPLFFKKSNYFFVKKLIVN